MKIIDSYWEKENLGVSSKEVIIEADDKEDVIREGLSHLNEQYIVVKVPSNMPNVVDYLHDMEYRYIEDLISVEHDLHEIMRNRIYQRLYDSVEYRRMTEADIEQLYIEIGKGMFNNDRISNDPLFSVELSARRYTNWIKSMIKEGALPYVMVYKGASCGFVILKTNDGEVYHSVLGGGYSHFRNSGIGIVQKEQEIVKGLGGKMVTTNVSSNNVNQFKALLTNGYTLSKIYHVFVKHNSGII